MTPGMAYMDIGIFNLNVIRYLTTGILLIWNMRPRLKKNSAANVQKKMELFVFHTISLYTSNAEVIIFWRVQTEHKKVIHFISSIMGFLISYCNYILI